jgi:hypothetical protein
MRADKQFSKTREKFAKESPNEKINTRTALSEFNTRRHNRTRAHSLSLSYSYLRERVSHGLVPLFWKIKRKIQEEAEQEAQRSDLINLRYFCEEKLSEF